MEITCYNVVNTGTTKWNNCTILKQRKKGYRLSCENFWRSKSCSYNCDWYKVRSLKAENIHYHQSSNLMHFNKNWVNSFRASPIRSCLQEIIKFCLEGEEEGGCHCTYSSCAKHKYIFSVISVHVIWKVHSCIETDISITSVSKLLWSELQLGSSYFKKSFLLKYISLLFRTILYKYWT